VHNNIRRLADRLIGAGTLVWAIGALSGCAQNSPPDFTGIWSGNFTTQDNEFWQVEDFTACFAGCSPASRQFLSSLLDDPANDERPVQELWNQTVGFMRQELAAKATAEGLASQNTNTEANDPTILCAPYGLVRQAANPLPLAIRRDGENLVIDYEEWGQSRTIYMDGRGHPPNPAPTRLGHSIGRYEGAALVVETVGLEPDIYYSFQSGGSYSAQTTVVERYTLHDDPRRLVLEMTVTDPVMLREPHVLAKTWLSTPDLEMIEDSCEDIPGKP
jgi:hypothetical protein